jgi:hypothetical protein
MLKKIIDHLYHRRDKERYRVIQKRWEVEKLKEQLRELKTKEEQK